MDAVPQLTEGACARFHSGDKDDEQLWTSSPIVQLLSIKKVSASQGHDRYRVIISDGVNFIQSMLATQLNSLVEADTITKNTICKLTNMSCNVIQNKRLVVVLGLSVVQRDAEKIGNPAAFPTDDATTPAANNITPTSAPSATTTPSVPQQPRQQQSSRGTRNNIFPIEGLSPYQNNWTIKARVIQKSDIRTYSNQRGEGKFFNVTLMDDSGEIKGTGFNAVADELYDKLVEDKVYYISKARVNLSKRKFSSAQEYELSLERNTEIEECHDTSNLPVVKYNFVELGSLEELPKDSICDVIGVVKEVSEVSEIQTKTQRTLSKRELTLVDSSAFSVRLTLWGKQAEQYNASPNSVIAFKGVKVGDFGGRSLSMFSSSTMAINPDMPEAHNIRGWYDDIGTSTQFQAHTSSMTSAGTGGTINRSEMRTLNDVKESQLGSSDKVEYFSCRATVMHIRGENISYPACGTEGCSKKVVEGHDGWRCEKCDRSFETPTYRYMIQMAVADYSGQAWLSGFNDVGLVVFGMTANELHDIKERDDAIYTAILQKATCNTYNFACRAKQDTFNDTTRVRYGISRIQPLNYEEETQSFVDLLKSPWAQ